MTMLNCSGSLLSLAAGLLSLTAVAQAGDAGGKRRQRANRRAPDLANHPNFGKHLEKEMKKLGLECVRRLSSDYPVEGRNMNQDMLAWIKKHFKMKP